MHEYFNNVDHHTVTYSCVYFIRSLVDSYIISIIEITENQCFCFYYRTITAISGQTLTLDSALAHKHVAESETFGSTTVELRGEVGLLSHNVKFQGSSDVQFEVDIKACPDGFNTGKI